MPPEAPAVPIAAPAPPVYVGGVISLVVPGGELKFFPSSNEFYAICKATPRHLPRCVLTRTRNERPGNPSQGRPLGLLMAFLKQGHMHDTKDAHKFMFDNSYQARLDARTELMGIEGSQELFRQERPLSGEPNDEPRIAP